jgi:hypothetical protein
MRNKSVLLIENMLEHLREVKVVIFWEKYRKASEGKVVRLERLREVSFNNGKVEILRRR